MIAYQFTFFISCALLKSNNIEHLIIRSYNSLNIALVCPSYKQLSPAQYKMFMVSGRTVDIHNVSDQISLHGATPRRVRVHVSPKLNLHKKSTMCKHWFTTLTFHVASKLQCIAAFHIANTLVSFGTFDINHNLTLSCSYSLSSASRLQLIRSFHHYICR